MQAISGMFEVKMIDGMHKAVCRVCGRVTQNRGSMRMHCVMVHGHDTAQTGALADRQAQLLTVVPERGISDCAVALGNADGQAASCSLTPKPDAGAQMVVTDGAGDSAVAPSPLGNE